MTLPKEIQEIADGLSPIARRMWLPGAEAAALHYSQIIEDLKKENEKLKCGFLCVRNGIKKFGESCTLNNNCQFPKCIKRGKFIDMNEFRQQETFAEEIIKQQQERIDQDSAKIITNIRGEVFTEGDRVMAFDIDGRTRCFGILMENIGYKNVSDFFVKYDDGKEMAVLDFDFLWKANP